MTDALLLPLLALVGLLAGSFGGMAVNRIPDSGLALFNPGPRCVRCEHALGLGDLVPIVSWFRLGGSCRHCKNRITWAYPALEAVMAVVFVVAGARFGATWTLLPVLVAFWTLTVASVIDLYIYAIPNRLTFPMLGMTAAIMAILQVAGADAGSLRIALIAMASYFALLAIPSLIYPAGLGFGDVKLALLMGLVVGYVAPSAIEGLVLILYALMIGSVGGAVVGLVLGALRKRGIDPLPDPWADDEVTDTEPRAADECAPEHADGKPVAVAAATKRKSHKAGFPFGPTLAGGCMAVTLFVDAILSSAG